MRAPPPDTSTLAVRFQLMNLGVGGDKRTACDCNTFSAPGDWGWTSLGAVLSNTASLRGSAGVFQEPRVLPDVRVTG